MYTHAEYCTVVHIRKSVQSYLWYRAERTNGETHMYMCTVRILSRCAAVIHTSCISFVHGNQFAL